MPDCGGYAPPGNLPHIELHLTPILRTWRAVLLDYRRVTRPSMEKPCLSPSKISFGKRQENRIAQIWAGMSGSTTRGDPIQGRQGRGRYPLHQMAVAVGADEVVENTMHPPGGEERSGGDWKTKRAIRTGRRGQTPPPTQRLAGTTEGDAAGSAAP